MKNKHTISDLVLLSLEKTVDGIVRFEDFTSHTYIYASGYDRPLKKSSLAQTLKRLRERGLVDLIKDEELIIRLTDQGRSEALWRLLIDEKQKWDGNWRIVTFDIPEKRRAVRDLLRYRLKQLGFKPWQQSVWISKKNCTKALKDYIRKVGIERWAKVIESTDVGF